LLAAVQKCYALGGAIDLVLVGAGTEILEDTLVDEPEWKRLVCRAFEALRLAGGSVKATGHVSAETLEAFFRDADVVVFPSLYEGYGLPVAEAVWRGLPVIASDLPPIREQLELFGCSERVRLVPLGDVDALSEALTDFANKRGPVRKSQKEMEPYFLGWTWQDAADTIVDKMKSVA
jgi:glycosyltransferase involved in cell wall biosynthesis